jgi:hypothetical protein
MKRFIIFASDHYYPIGGWSDYVAGFDTLDEAMDLTYSDKFKKQYDWWHIVDIIKGKIVSEGTGNKT